MPSRAFDPISQRSTESVQSVTLTPLREVFSADVSVDHWQAQTDELIQEYTYAATDKYCSRNNTIFNRGCIISVSSSGMST